MSPLVEEYAARHVLCERGMKAAQLIGVCALGLIAACSRSSSPENPAEAPVAPSPEGVVRIARASRAFVKVQPAQIVHALPALRAPARVAFREGSYSQLSAPLAGRVSQVHVNSGSAVKAGDPLVTLSCPEAASARSTLARAEAELREARAAFERETAMLKQGVGTERDRLASEIKLASEQAEYQRALETTRFVGAGQGGVVVLRAPIDGIMLTRRATVGAAVPAGGEPLVEVGDPKALWIVAEVFERDLSLIRVGLHAVTELTSVPHPIDGKVAALGAVVSEGMRTSPVRITCEGDLSGVRPGMFGRVQIFSDESGILLPAQAVLVKEGGETVVYIGRDELSFERRKVVVSPSLDGRVRVLSGLKPGEPVVIEGALLLDGAAEQLL